MCKINYNNWTSLHTHSVYSKDGTGDWELMVKRAKELGQNYLALTDHGTVSGFVNHYSVCKENDINPIYGIEGYISPDLNAKKVITNHITILAQGKGGYENLIALNNASHQRIVQKGSMKFPVMMFEDFKQFRQGLVVLTGCPSSMLYHDDEDIAYGYVENLVRIFGDDNVYAEMMFVREGHDNHSRPMQIAAELGIGTVITSDTHYAMDGDASVCVLNAGIRSRITKNPDYTYDYEGLHLLSAEEIVTKATKHISEEEVASAFSNIQHIVDGVEPVELESEVVVPDVDEESLDGFKALLRRKLDEYCANNPSLSDTARLRFQTEYDVIDTFDFWKYFYIVNDMVYFVRSNDRFSTARGSAGGSFIIYLLDICSVDPIKYNLLFERFLNTSRKDYPDIDLDVDSRFRPELVKYCEERWGLASVNTTITFAHRSLVRDISKEFDIDFETSRWLQDIGGLSDDFLEYCDEHPEFAHAYNLMIDQPKTVGTHAAAMASVNNDLLIPIEAWGNSLGIAFSESGTIKALSKIGGLKFDVLGLRALASLYKMYQTTGVLPPKDIDSDFPAPVFCGGKTLGIFQFDGSAGIQQMCVDVQPKSLDELATINSMYRPGALDAGTAEHYLEYKKNPRKFTPEIDAILEPTYSVIVYQEQVMDIYAYVTGEGREGADIARRILSPKTIKALKDPKWQVSVKEVQNNFMTKGREQGIDNKVLVQIWAELYTHSRYSFNKSHSINYAHLAAHQAWYKLNYPTEFYLSTLNALLEEGKSKNMQSYIWTMYKEGYTIKPPHVIKSSRMFELQDGELYLPITVVKNVSPRSLEALDYLKAYVNGTDDDFIANVIKETDNFAKAKKNGTNDATYFALVRERFDTENVTEVNTKSLSLLSSKATWNKTCKENLFALGAFDGVPGELTDLVSEDMLDEELEYVMTQATRMNVTIPTQRFLKYEAYAKSQGYIYGIIIKKQRKLTKKGVPVVEFKLTGNQTIRLYESQFEYIEYLKLQPGMPVMAQVNDWNYLIFVPERKGTKKLTQPRLKVAI